MIDIYDSEALVKTYRLLSKKCEAIDKFINNHALYFIASDECDTMDICDNICNLMDRKNKLINLKLIIDKCVSLLSENDKKILFLKMNYSLSIQNICTILDIKERTAFRRLEHAFSSLKDVINNSKFCDKVTSVLACEEWIYNTKQDIKNYRLAFKTKMEAVSSL